MYILSIDPQIQYLDTPYIILNGRLQNLIKITMIYNHIKKHLIASSCYNLWRKLNSLNMTN